MWRILILLLPFTFSLLPSAALAQEDAVKVSLNFDKTSAELGEQIRMTIRVEGGQGAIERPRIPQMNGFNTYYLGRTSEILIVNGRQTSFSQFSFSLEPIAAGKYKIPPIVVEVGDSLYRTPASTIEVLGQNGQISGAPQAGSPQAPNAPQSYFPPSTPPSQFVQPPRQPAFEPSQGGNEVFAKASVDRPSVYVGEQVNLTYSIYFRTDASLEGFEREPVTTGFWTEEINLGQNIPKKKTNVAGLDYLTTDFRRIALFATRDGVFDIETGTIRATIVEQPRRSGSTVDDLFNDNFFQSGGFITKKVPRILQVNPVRINVVPLPEEGRPASFSGAVGEFTFQSSVDKRSVEQNEAVALTLSIDGGGNISTVNRPELPEIEGVKVYESDASTQVAPHGSVIGGRKTFEITLIPSERGSLTIPAIEFSFFNPRTKSYQVQKTNPISIEVRKGTSSADIALPGGGEAAKKKAISSGDKIFTIREKLSPGFSIFLIEKERMINQVLAVLAGLSTLAALFLLYHYRKEEFYLKNSGLKRRIFAEKRASQGLRRLLRFQKSPSEAKQKKFFAEAHKTMCEYLADKFNISAQGITLTEIEAQLAHFQMDSALYEKIRDFYEVTDRAIFAPNLISGTESAGLITTLQETIKTLEKHIR